ncbi:hypothetical protein [Halorubrum trueperi]|uniref:Uncharacterized protein n=1 Tax=Halorubrum trueperi TaxID=2004704 RepID=A0ABD5UNJ9_9EURY
MSNPECESAQDESADRTNDGRGTRTVPSRCPWAAVAGAAAVVLLASLLPVPVVAPGGSTGIDPLPAGVSLTVPFHLAGYALLSVLAARASLASWPAIRRGDRENDNGNGAGIVVASGTGIVVATAVGFGVELAQSTIPWRSFAWGDVAVNAVGATAGVVIAGVFAAAVAVAATAVGDRRSR